MADFKDPPKEALEAEEAAARAFLNIIRASMRAANAGQPGQPMDFAINSAATAIDRVACVAIEDVDQEHTADTLRFIAGCMAQSAGFLLSSFCDHHRPAALQAAITLLVEGAGGEATVRHQFVAMH